MFSSFVLCLVFVSVGNSGNQKKKHLAFAAHSRDGDLSEEGREAVAKIVHSLKISQLHSNPLPSLSIFDAKGPTGQKEVHLY